MNINNFIFDAEVSSLNRTAKESGYSLLCNKVKSRLCCCLMYLQRAVMLYSAVKLFKSHFNQLGMSFFPTGSQVGGRLGKRLKRCFMSEDMWRSFSWHVTNKTWYSLWIMKYTYIILLNKCGLIPLSCLNWPSLDLHRSWKRWASHPIALQQPLPC